MTGTTPFPDPRVKTQLPLGLSLPDLARVGIPALTGFTVAGLPGFAVGSAAGLAGAKAAVNGKTVDVHTWHAAQHVAGTRIGSWYDRVDSTQGAVLLANGTVFSLIEVGSVDIGYLSDSEAAANMAAVTDFLSTVDYPASLVSGQRMVDIGNDAVRSTDHYVVIPAYPSEAEAVEDRQETVDRRANDAVSMLTGADMHAHRVNPSEEHPVMERLLAEPVNIGVWGYETGDSCRRVLRVTDFPGEIGTGWIADLLDLNVPGRVDVVQRVDPVGADERSWLRKRLQVARGEQAAATSPSRVQALNQTADEIQQLLAAELDGEPLIDYGVYIVVSGDSWGIVGDTISAVKRELGRHRIKTRAPWFRMNQVAKVVTGLSPDTVSDTYVVSGRSVAAGFPWAATDTVEPGGVEFGEDDESGRPIVLDRFSWASPHVAIMGKTGSGKTFFTKLQLLRCSREYNDLQVLVLDLKPGLEYGDLVGALECPVQRWKIGDRTADNPDLLEQSLREAYEAVRDHDGRSVLVVDEAHRVLNDESARLVLDRLVREGRSHSVSVMPVTQNTGDFTRLDEQGKSMLRQVGCTVFFQHDDVSSQVEQFFRLSSSETTKLHKLLAGDEAGVSQALVRGPVQATVTVQPRTSEAERIGEPGVAGATIAPSGVLSMPEPEGEQASINVAVPSWVDDIRQWIDDVLPDITIPWWIFAAAGVGYLTLAVVSWLAATDSIWIVAATLAGVAELALGIQLYIVRHDRGDEL